MPLAARVLALLMLAGAVFAETPAPVITHDAAKKVSTITAGDVTVALPYAEDWTLKPSPVATWSAVSEHLAMIASVSVDDWGEPIDEKEYLRGQLDAVRAKAAVEDESVGGFGVHPVLSYITPLGGADQLHVWAVRQGGDGRVIRLHVSAIAEERAAVTAVRARAVQLAATGYVVAVRVEP